MPVLSFNGSKYDINLMKQYLHKSLEDCGEEVSRTIKKANAYMSLKSDPHTAKLERLSLTPTATGHVPGLGVDTGWQARASPGPGAARAGRGPGTPLELHPGLTRISRRQGTDSEASSRPPAGTAAAATPRTEECDKPITPETTTGQHSARPGYPGGPGTAARSRPVPLARAWAHRVGAWGRLGRGGGRRWAPGGGTRRIERTNPGCKKKPQA
jgi:hypothetical protein